MAQRIADIEGKGSKTPQDEAELASLQVPLPVTTYVAELPPIHTIYVKRLGSNSKLIKFYYPDPNSVYWMQNIVKKLGSLLD